MPAPSFTYTLTNGTTADASQVMQNFNDIRNGVTDGTKDLSISALTCAGTATFNGGVTLGNAAGDDITFTGSIASTIPIKTTAAFDIGSSTIGLQSVYFGGNSQTVRVQGSSSMSATYTLTLPVNAGTNNYVLQTNGSGVTSWTDGSSLVAAGASTAGIITTGTQTIAGAKTFSDALTFDVTDLTDAMATSIGLKQYKYGTAYNGGIVIEVSGTNSWSTQDGYFVPYQMEDATWRMRFNIMGTTSSATSSTVTFDADNTLTFKNLDGTNEGQALSGFSDQNANTRARAGDNTSAFLVTCSSASTSWSVSGDVALAAKPAWAY